jgi:hypothetical protein
VQVRDKPLLVADRWKVSYIGIYLGLGFRVQGFGCRV